MGQLEGALSHVGHTALVGQPRPAGLPADTTVQQKALQIFLLRDRPSQYRPALTTAPTPALQLSL